MGHKWGFVTGVLIFFVNLSVAAEVSSVDDFHSGHALYCKDNACPSYIAGVVFRGDTLIEAAGPAIGKCSGTLISANKVLTNLHCLPLHLRAVGSDCHADVEILFPQSYDKPAQAIACAKVESVSKYNSAVGGNDDDSDWAILKLRNEVQRDVAVMNKGPLNVGEKISGYAVYYNGLFPLGEIRQVTCVAEELGYLFPGTFHPAAQLFYASNCSEAIVKGNSGTGFFNDSSEFVGLVNSVVKSKFQTKSDVEINGSTNVMGTRAACVGEDLPTICGLAKDDIGFQSAAVNYSSLLALKRALKNASIFHGDAPKSDLISWGMPEPDQLPSLLAAYYDYLNIAETLLYFKDPKINLGYVADDVLQAGTEILGYAPKCIHADAVKGDEMSASMPYLIFSFRDETLFPGEGGQLYLKTRSDLVLDVTARKIDLPIKIKKSDGGYSIVFEALENPFAMSNEQEKFVQDHCQPQSEDDVLPNPSCQKIFIDVGFSFYVKPFALEVPACGF